MAKSWDACAKAAMKEYAERKGGGSFTQDMVLGKLVKDIVSSFPWIKPYYEEETRDGLVQLAIEVCVDDMNKWMNLKRDPSPMVDMLRKLDDCSTTTPQGLLKNYLDIGKDIYGDKYNVTCLSMVVLVKVVAASVLDPSIAIIKSMRDTLGEALELFTTSIGK
ncbi:hypothetical protein Sjap_026001 [Stephania japonica]|uniref:Uncharacterized protein n=1 Tax=Stephania japonica TaxID=461633 RepID=A0AAP0HK22_9MAGN